MSTHLTYVAATAAALTIFAGTPLSAQHIHNQPSAAVSAAVEVTGTVLCVDGPALPGAIVQLYKGDGREGQPLVSGLTDAGGKFRLRAPIGTYTLRATYLGHASLSQTVIIDRDGHAHQLGALRLDISAVEIDAVVATVEKDVVQLRAGSSTFDPKRSAAAAGGSVAEVLRNVPAIELDRDGNITMRGGHAALVLINGRRAVLKDAALAAFLRQMPASALEKIEVNTAPSAGQEADGVGMVNLVFHEAGQDRSLSYSVASSASTAQQYAWSAAASGALHAFTWDAAYAFSSMRPQTFSHTMRDNFVAPDSLRTSHQESRAGALHMLHSVMAGASAQLTTNNSLNGSFSYSWMRGSFGNVTDFADISTVGTWSPTTSTISTLEHTIPTAEGTLSWMFKQPGARRLRLSSEVRVARGSERFFGEYANDTGAGFLATDMDFARNEIAAQHDVAIDIAGSRLELGQKTTRRWIDASYASIRTDADLLDRFAYDQNIIALYATSSRSLGSAFLQTGLRAERTGTTVEWDGTRSTGTAWELFPSVSLHWPHHPDGVMQYQVSYGRRIQRPDAAALNPFSMGEDDMNSFIGNPSLLPEISDQFELSMVRYGDITLQATPFVRLARNPARPIKAVTASGRATTSLQNLDRARSAGIDLSAKTRLNDKVTALVSTSAFYAHTEGRDVSARGMYVNLRANVDVSLAEHTTAHAYVYRRSAQPVEQGEILPSLSSDVALTHRFGNSQRGTFTVRVSDPLDQHKLAFRLKDQTFAQHSERKVTSRMLSVSLSWSVGDKRNGAEVTKEEAPPRIF